MGTTSRGQSDPAIAVSGICGPTVRCRGRTTAPLRLLLGAPERYRSAFRACGENSPGLLEAEPTVVTQRVIRSSRRIVVLQRRSAEPCMRAFALVASSPLGSVPRRLKHRSHVPLVPTSKVASGQVAPLCAPLRLALDRGYARRVWGTRASGTMVRENFDSSMHPKPNHALHPTAKRRCRLVPVALRAPAAGEGKRWASRGAAYTPALFRDAAASYAKQHRQKCSPSSAFNANRRASLAFLR